MSLIFPIDSDDLMAGKMSCSGSASAVPLHNWHTLFNSHGHNEVHIQTT